MRLFVAITPPRAVLLEVRSAVDAVIRTGNGVGSNAKLRWTRPDTWHITLAFYGEVDEDKLDDLSERLGRVAARATPMELSLAGAGRFGPRVVWFGVQGQCDRLGRLAEAAGSAARRCHIRVEDRPYRPHLTLARVAGVPRRAGGTGGTGGSSGEDQAEPVDLTPLVDRLKPFRSPGWLAGDIELFNVVEGVLDADGNEQTHTAVASKRYERIAHWPLTGR
jgi:RNA 2',3'-cyclic 3'-phosphodiesterase